MRENQIIGELVAKDYRTASVFKKYSIDFCCQGNRTIQEACDKKNIDSKKVLEDLDTLVQTKSEATTDYQSWPLDLLADYIEKKHHRYVEDKTLEIQPYLDKIYRVHGEHHPELFEIKNEFNASAGELAAHMKKEELILIPFVKKMYNALRENNSIEQAHFGTVSNPIAMMMDEHDNEGERFRIIAKLTNDYNPPADACETYKVTFAMLKEFEQDLHKHIHLENNIVFPKAKEMETKFNIIEPTN